MKRLSLIVSAVSAAVMLSGCGSLTGFSNAKTDFACADLSGGPSCRNISQVYEENNPTTPVLLAASEEENFVQPFFEPNQTMGNPEVKTESTEVSVEQTQTSAVERTSDFVTIVPAYLNPFIRCLPTSPRIRMKPNAKSLSSFPLSALQANLNPSFL